MKMDRKKLANIGTAFGTAALTTGKLIVKSIKKERLTLEEQVREGKIAEKKLKESGFYTPDFESIRKEGFDYICNLIKDEVNSSLITKEKISYCNIKLIAEMHGYDIAWKQIQNSLIIVSNVNGEIEYRKKYVLSKGIKCNNNSYTLFV